MDISVTAVKTGRRRYLTLIMIFITVVICYVDRANLAVASAHIQEEFGISKAEMGYVFSAFARLYTLCQITAVGSLTAWDRAYLLYRYIWLVGGDVATRLRHRFNVAYRFTRHYRHLRSASLPDQQPHGDQLVPGARARFRRRVLYLGAICWHGFPHAAADLDPWSY